MDLLIIFGAKYLVFVVAAAAAVIVFFDKEQRVKIFYIAVIALSAGYVLARLAGVFFSHNQPFAEQGFAPLIPHAVDNSFPSDHMLISGIFASLAFLSSRRAGLVLWALALLVGVSRILSGLHYVSDVLASVVLAAAAVWLAYKALKLK